MIVERYYICLCYECSQVYIGVVVVFFQAEDGIRDLVRSRGLGDVYKRQNHEKEHKESSDALRRRSLRSGVGLLLGR